MQIECNVEICLILIVRMVQVIVIHHRILMRRVTILNPNLRARDQEQHRNRDNDDRQESSSIGIQTSSAIDFERWN